MKPCPHCEASCPDRAMVCPHCGYMFSAEMQGAHWVRAPWRPEPGTRRPRTSGSAGGTLPTDTGAMLTLILGAASFIGAWLAVGVLFAIPGIGCGLAARRRIQRAKGSLGGEMAAQSGLALCVMALIIGLCMGVWMVLHWPEFAKDLAQSMRDAIRQFSA